MNRHSERRRIGDVDNEERWLLTYSDMITLLLAVFVVLFALSTISHTKFAEFKTGVHKALSSAGTPIPTSSQNTASQLHDSKNVTSQSIATSHEHPATRNVSTNNLEQIERQIHSALAAQGLLGSVALLLSANSLKIRVVADQAFFNTNSDALSLVGQEVVDTVGGVLANDTNSVVVDGFTDSTPVVGAPFYSNYMLSAARAVEVVERLVHQDRVADDRIYAVAYGSSHPAASNATAAGRARNRRVDIVVLGSGTT